MKSIADRLKEVVKTEEKKEPKNKNIKEFDELVEQMEKFGPIRKPEYSLPMVDTLGKTYYSNTNKLLFL